MLLIALAEDAAWLAAPVSSGTVVAILVAVTGWFLTQRLIRYDKHLDECAKKSVDHAKLELKVDAVDAKIDSVAKTVAGAHAAMENKIDVVCGKVDAVSGDLKARTAKFDEFVESQIGVTAGILELTRVVGLRSHARDLEPAGPAEEIR